MRTPNRLSNRRARARARYVSRPQAVTTPNECPLTIGQLSDEVLLNIFRYYLDASPQLWPRLVHICHKWRQIVFASQQALRLRLFCTPGTPVLKTLDLWPALPIVVHYGGSLAHDPTAPEDEDNIMAALKQSARVSSIRLAATRSLREAFNAIEAPFSELEDLVLFSQDGVRLTLPNTFRWGPQLHSLHLTRITFPALPQLLSTSRNLVDLQLHGVFKALRLSPEALGDALSGMTQLQALSLHFLPTASFVGATSPSGGRVVLPAITRLDFRGMSEYLEGLVVRMYAPRLGDIEITLFDELIFDVPNLRKFIGRIKMQMSHSRADVLFSGHTISISFTRPGAPVRSELRISHEPLNRKLPSMTEICNRLATFLSGVEDLCVLALSSGQDNMDCEKWAKLIYPFRGTKWFHIAGDLSTDIVLSLQLSGKRRKTLLPALQKLYIREPGPRHVPLREAVVSLMMSRRLSGHRIEVEYERLRVNELRGTVVPFSRQVTIEMLPDDVLLNIFRHYLYAFPQFWPTLTHVGSRWRRVVLRSPLGLHLRLYCTYGTPVLKTLKYWPPFPLVVNYGGSPMSNLPVREDEENIMAALKQPDRVGFISLTVTNSLLKNLSTIPEPFTELEELVLLSRYNAQLTFPGAFQSGARLRTLQLTRIAIPALPQLLSPCTGIVDLQLHKILNVGYFPPEVFANALSEMTQLETLSLHFLSPLPRRKYLSLPPPSEERIVLPALTCLQYRGTSKYLDNFVARIDAPRLEDIGITFFNQPTIDALQLGRFVERIEMQTSLSRADVQTSTHAISICFSNPGGNLHSLICKYRANSWTGNCPRSLKFATIFPPFYPGSKI
ncbi:hypothetical protein EDB87DRAFT_436977 [Lactarius vividus]|nr:hypothetical protein EDB87DRAFT_436977 [Lactarius vividus]